MPKRTNRVRPIRHHQEQLEALKNLEPIGTPDDWRPFADTLVDVAVQALEVLKRLEAHGRVGQSQMQHLFDLVRDLPAYVPRKGTSEDGEDDGGAG